MLTRRDLLLGAATAAWCPSQTAAARDRADALAWLTIDEAARGLRRGRFTSEDLVRACLARIDAFDGRVNSFITVTRDAALEDARRADRELRAGSDRGPLHGIPIAVKDNVDTAGVRTTAASRAFENRVPATDAAVVARLRAAGVVSLGKLNMHELAAGTTSAIGAFGPVRNPWNPDHVAGGSSGGSGAAVAAGFCYAAVGTDTGGSVRVPAACCGVVGFKPTFGVVSTEGVMLLSDEFDHVGPLCRTVVDAAHVLRAMSAHPAATACDPAALPGVRNLRVGVLPPSFCGGPIARDIQRAFDRAVRAIGSIVASVVPAELPVPEELGAIIEAEAWQRYASLAATRPDAFDSRTRATFGLDGPAPAVDLPALRLRLAAHRAAVGPALANVDLVVSPTLPTAAIPLASDGEPFAQSDCTFGFSIAGLPAISVPCGATSTGLPIGLQIGGPAYSDARVLALARAFEQRSPWQRRRPMLRAR